MTRVLVAILATITALEAVSAAPVHQARGDYDDVAQSGASYAAESPQPDYATPAPTVKGYNQPSPPKETIKSSPPKEASSRGYNQPSPPPRRRR